MPGSAEKMSQAGMDVVQADSEGKYLTFVLDEEEYGISILKVKEIIGMMPITPVPRTPVFVKGVINLRGKVNGGDRLYGTHLHYRGGDCR